MNELLPPDWSQVSMSSIGETFNGLTGKSGDDFSEGEPFVTYLQVFNGKTHDKSLCGKVRINGAERQNRIQYGDLLFTTSSETADEVGYATAFLTQDFQPFLNSFCFGFRLNNWELFDPRFAKHYLLGDRFRRQMIRLAQGSTRYNLSKTEFLKTDLSLPPIKEQQKIAEILTSVDEVIENTQSQIDKLEDLKKATMNELLTKGIGHTEFKETEIGRIPKEWVLKHLGMVCKVTTGKKDTKNKQSFGRYPFFVRSQTVERINDYSYDEEAVLTAGDGVGTGKVFHYVNGKYECHQRVYRLTQFREIYGKFVFYYFSNNFLKRVQEMSAKGSVDSVRLEMITEMPVAIPPPSEQMQIINHLETLNLRLDMLETKKSSLDRLKKSLMQDLLTGKVRVKVN